MYRNFIKRALDIVVSLILIIILSPFMLLTALAIKLESPGSPVVFSQPRMGLGRVPFRIYKFRSMSTKAPSNVATADIDSSQYISRVGAFIRATSLDELPQLFNILNGTMSFVGPRPVVLAEEELIERRAELGVYAVKPGVTGLAQVQGRDLVSIEKKAQLDADYVKRCSAWLDIKIMLMTVPKVLLREGIHEGDGDK